MGEIWRMGSHMDSVIKAYKTLAKIPSIVGGRLNNKGNKISSRWSVRNLDKGRNSQYLIDYILDDNLKVIAESDFGVDVSHEVLTAVSPRENFKAVIREEKDEKEAKKKFFLEVWSRSSLKHSVDLNALDIHGDVYADSEFGCLDWSPDEKSLVYVAEKKVKKSEAFIKRKATDDKNKDSDKKPTQGEEFIYKEDWGEQLTGKINSVVVVCKLPEETFTVLENIPDSWCPGQMRFAPDGKGVVGMAWVADSRRLGLIYCTNRPSYIFHLTLDGNLKTISGANKAVRSPRVSSCGDLVWLQRDAQGPHHACHQLARLPAQHLQNIADLQDEDIRSKLTIVIDIVPQQKEISFGEIFYGIYSLGLPAKGFSADGKRLVFSTPQQNEIRTYVVDIESGKIVDISNNKKVAGSTTVLCVQSDVILASCSNMTTPGQLYTARLPSAGKEQEISWVQVSAPNEVPRSVRSAKLQYMSLKHDDCPDSVSSFTAIYFGPDEGGVYPLVVWPHGGPHSAFANSYSLEAAFFNMIGFASVRINFRGSSGSGDASLRCLMGNIGDYDTRDCLLVLETLKKQENLQDKYLLYGGSYGGFVACHLAGRYPDLFKAMVLRNPLIDLATKANCADNPDGCAVEIGMPFSEEGPDLEEKLVALRRVSPLVHAHRVTAPTALMLGSKDKRVPYYQGLEYSRRLKANGVMTKVFMYDDNHALSSLPAEMDNLINGADWLITMIKP